MGLLETLIVGAYVWATTLPVVLFGFVWRRVERIQQNHIAHLEARVKELEDGCIGCVHQTIRPD